MTVEGVEKLKYPIGKFQFPENPSREDLTSWISDIESLPGNLKNLCHGLNDNETNRQYREGSWNIREVVHHLADSHLNSFIRFKWALTENEPVIKAYNENDWSKLADYKSSINLSLTLIDALHQRWVYLLKNMSEDEFQFAFIHPESNRKIKLTTNTALYAWHSKHHTKHIEIALGL